MYSLRTTKKSPEISSWVRNVYTEREAFEGKGKAKSLT